jgi:hypothetical protein
LNCFEGGTAGRLKQHIRLIHLLSLLIHLTYFWFAMWIWACINQAWITSLRASTVSVTLLYHQQ